MVKKILTSVMLVAALTGCQKKVLVLYYSQTGTTKAVAEVFQEQLGADIEAIDITEPYTGDFNQTIMRCQQERSSGYVPTLNPLTCDLSKYDVIYLGYPIWFGTYAPPVQALLNSVDLSGKTIVPFCTFGSGGLEVGVADLKKALPTTTILDGYGVRTARVASAPQEVSQFLISSGLKEGEIETLPDFSEEHPVTEAEAAVFHAACDSYQFPLGNPVAVATRPIANGTEYRFQVEAMNAKTIIYVVETPEATEFTRVVR